MAWSDRSDSSDRSDRLCGDCAGDMCRAGRASRVESPGCRLRGRKSCGGRWLCRPFRAQTWGGLPFPGLHPGLVCDALSALGTPPRERGGWAGDVPGVGAVISRQRVGSDSSDRSDRLCGDCAGDMCRAGRASRVESSGYRLRGRKSCGGRWLCRPFRAQMWGALPFPGLHPGLVCDALSALGTPPRERGGQAREDAGAPAVWVGSAGSRVRLTARARRLGPRGRGRSSGVGGKRGLQGAVAAAAPAVAMSFPVRFLPAAQRALNACAASSMARTLSGLQLE
jgi:hypothetical protein